MGEGLEIFISYAHEDERLRQKLETHLALLQQQGLITTWHDRNISAGTEWATEINTYLNRSRILLLLVSAAFLASKYCYSVEMARALERHEANEARVIPIILRPVDWENAPFRKLQALPTDGHPITGRRWRNLDEAFDNVARGIRKVVEELRSQENGAGQKSSSTSSYYRSIINLPPPTDSRTIQQRRHTVEAIYSQLVQSDIAAIVLTGIGGIGKSTLAALIYDYVEKQRRNDQGLFTGESLWLKVDESTTLIDLVGTLFKEFGRPLPEGSSLTPQRLVIPFFKALNTAEKPRLIVLDQFENFLDPKTGQALATSTGIGELLDVLNSQRCSCRILLTSRPRPRGTRDYTETHLKEYPAEGLSFTEGVDLLRKHGVQGTEAELQMAVQRCDGHAYALTLLASLLGMLKERLAQLIENSEFWREDIATQFLDQIYKQKLDNMHRELLQAFSVYREAVPIEAVQALLPAIPKATQRSVLRALLTQYLLQPAGEGRFKLHAIVTDYVKDHFDESSEQLNRQKLRATHAKAADHYLQQAKAKCPPREQRGGIADVYLLVEAIWQQCQAGLWQQAYDLIEQEGLFDDLYRRGGNVTLLELYQLMLPLERWNQKNSLVAQRIYFCLGSGYRALGQIKQARVYFGQMSQASIEGGDLSGQAKALVHLGWTYEDSGNREKAREYHNRALQIYREIGDRSGEGQALMNIGWNCENREQAKEYYEQALKLYTEIEDDGGKAWTLGKLATVDDVLGNKEQAIEYRLQGLSMMREIGETMGVGWTLKHLGQLYRDVGQLERAQDSLNQSLDVFRSARDYRGEGWALNSLGRLYIDLGQKELAKKTLDLALNIFTQMEDQWGKGAVLNKLGRLHHRMGQEKQALADYSRALNQRRETKDIWGEGQTLLEIGALYFEQQHYDLALAFFLLSQECFEKAQSPDQERVREQINVLHADVGEQEFILLSTKARSQGLQTVEQSLLDDNS